ncbi:MAG: hypothetical protein ISF22_09530 [Methanomassiliicoccus sp.]|nr:hypothetical protein [Methanomassiliicoccus sp.]
MHALTLAKVTASCPDEATLINMLAELVGPTDVEDVLDIIRMDLYFQYRDGDETLFEDMDDRYRQLAARLIYASGRSATGKLKKKMTIMVVEPPKPPSPKARTTRTRGRRPS